MASIFTTQTPATTSGDSAVSVGVVFTVDQACTSTGGRYYKLTSAFDNQTFAMGLWDGSGALIATGSRVQSASDPVGWITVNWASSATLSTGQTYTVGYLANTGYSYTGAGVSAAIDNAPFHTPATAARFTYGATLQRPAANSTGTNFFADIIATAGSSGANVVATPADTAAGSDAGTVSAARVRTVSDTAAGSDSGAATSTRDRTVSDSAAGSDSVVVQRTGMVGRLHAVSVSGRGFDAADQAAGSDQLTATVDRPRTASDVAAGSDDAASAADRLTAADDAAGGQDSAVSSWSRVAAADDAADGSDGAASPATRVRSVDDSAAGSDTATTTASVARSASDTAAGGDAAQSDWSRDSAFADTAAGGDQAVTVWVRARPAADAAAGADELLVDRTGEGTEAVSDPATAADTVTTERASLRTSADPAAGTDQLEATRGAGRASEDSADGSDELTVDWARFVYADDTAGGTEDHELQLAGGLADSAAGADEVEVVWVREVFTADFAAAVETVTDDGLTAAAPIVWPGPVHTRRLLGGPGIRRTAGEHGYRPGPRIVLHDRPQQQPATRAVLDADSRPTAEVTVDQLIYRFQIRGRTSTGYDDDGNALFAWTDLVNGIALKYEEREEYDSTEGFTYRAGLLLLANEANVPIPESAVAVNIDNGERWRIRSVDDLPDASRLYMERLDG